MLFPFPAQHSFNGGTADPCQFLLYLPWQVELCGQGFEVRPDHGDQALATEAVEEVPGGKGHVSYWLKKNKLDFISCDVSNTGVTSAFVINSPIISTENINVVELKHEYILPFDNSSFDVVLSFGVLEHVPNDLESLKEIYRILKKNGLFFLFLFTV
jgi:SAM-dependent methyltransferase